MIKFSNEDNFSHSNQQNIGVLLVNHGSPEKPTPKVLRTYLKEFLTDPRVIEVPRILWFFILHLTILPRRSRISAQKYKSIWTKRGPKLVVTSQNILQKLRLAFGTNKHFHFRLAMNYGSPSLSINKALNELRHQNCRRLLILPMYPHYASATVASVFTRVVDEIKTWRWIPELRCINQYHDHPDYIASLAKSIKEHWQNHKKGELLIFSYHGTPLQSLYQGDPYHCQCHKTSRLVADSLGLKERQYMVCFQSRFGKKVWLQPYTDKTLLELGQKGVTSIDIICPGFSVDCLETQEEISQEAKKSYIQAGGKSYHYIHCLNDEKQSIQLYKTIITQHTQGWVCESKPFATQQKEQQNQQERYANLKEKHSFYL